MDWFQHDKDMRNDLRIKALRKKFGAEGYCVWSWLLEILCDESSYELEWNDMNCMLLAADFDIDEQRLQEIIEYTIKLNLFQVENGYLSSNNFTNRMAKVDKKSAQAAAAGRASAEARRRSNEPMGNEQNSNGCSTDVQRSFNGCSTDVQQAFNGVQREKKEKEAKRIKERNETRQEETRQEENFSFSSKPSFSQPDTAGTPAAADEEKKIISLFFFQNFTKPNEEYYKKFIPYNNLDGRNWESMSQQQRMSAAMLWKQKDGTSGRFSPEFIAMWQQVYDRLIAIHAPEDIIMDAISDDLRWDRKGGNLEKLKHTLTCSHRLKDFIERNLDHFKPILLSYNNGQLGELHYNITKK